MQDGTMFNFDPVKVAMMQEAILTDIATAIKPWIDTSCNRPHIIRVKNETIGGLHIGVEIVDNAFVLTFNQSKRYPDSGVVVIKPDHEFDFASEGEVVGGNEGSEG